MQGPTWTQTVQNEETWNSQSKQINIFRKKLKGESEKSANQDEF